MEKIKLSERAKEILYEVFAECYEPFSKDKFHVSLLEYEELIENTCTKDDKYGIGELELTTKGEAYLALYPELENPSWKDDKAKYIASFLGITLETIINNTIN